MNKQDIYNYLQQNNIWYEKYEHSAVYNMLEASKLHLPYPESDAKNIFVRDDKKQKYYLITIKGNKKINLKELKAKYNTRTLSFASREELQGLLSLTPGAVTPFGLLNDEKKIVYFFLDRDFFNNPGLIGVHPNDNTETVFLKTCDLVEIIKKHGNVIEIIEEI